MSISGIGDKTTRVNEITPDDVAFFRNFVCGHNAGILYNYQHDFYAYVDGFTEGTDNSLTASNRYSNTVHVTDGMMFAYGYFGYAPAVDFVFLPPAVEQWQLIYVELDRSIMPNTCKIKTKNNHGGGRVLPNTFRQDELSTIKTGVFQLPLWAIRVTNKGIEVEDLRTNEYKNPQGRKYDYREVVKMIKSVETSNFTNKIVKTIPSNVYCPTQPQGTNNATVASTLFAAEEIENAINK